MKNYFYLLCAILTCQTSFASELVCQSQSMYSPVEQVTSRPSVHGFELRIKYFGRTKEKVVLMQYFPWENYPNFTEDLVVHRTKTKVHDYLEDRPPVEETIVTKLTVSRGKLKLIKVGHLYDGRTLQQIKLSEDTCVVNRRKS